MCSLFVCFMLVFNDPTSPTPYPVDAKGPVHHPQSSSTEERFLQLHSGRQREAALTPGCLGIYCYANVNFTRGCWVLVGVCLFVCLFCQQKQQKIHLWSSLLPFVTEFVTMHFLKRRKAGKGERSRFASLCLSSFCVHGIPTSKREAEERLSRSA